METGYDYLLIRWPLWQRLVQGSGIILVIIGAVFLSAGVAYYAYAHYARSSLDDLNFSVATTATQSSSTLPATNSPAVAIPIDPVIVTSLSPATSTVTELPGELAIARQEFVAAATTAAPVEAPKAPGVFVQLPADELSGGSPALLEPVTTFVAPALSPSVIASQQLYPGEALKATYWSEPFEYEPVSLLEASLIEGFRPFDANVASPIGTLAAPTHILIPSIGVDSDVVGLRVMNLGDSRAYETPKHVVGHIPESSNPGEQGSAWLFGHLESPIAGEGNVFYHLPKIPNLLRKGEEVYTIVESGETAYLYRIKETKVVHQNDMQRYDDDGSSIHLVVCVPRLVYDHRLIVTGTLVGVRN